MLKVSTLRGPKLLSQAERLTKGKHSSLFVLSVIDREKSKISLTAVGYNSNRHAADVGATTLSITTLGITTLSINDTKHKRHSA